MKGIWILLLGGMIWSGSLLWPEVNLLVSPATMLAMLAGATTLLSLFVVAGRLSQRRRTKCCDTPPCRNIPDCTTRSVAATLSSR